MPRESIAQRRLRTDAVRAALSRAYPAAHCELEFGNPLELLIATILSAQCSDKQVNLVTRDLFARYRCAADYASAPLAQLENDVRRIGLFRNKARHIKSTCLHLVDYFQGQVPKSLEELVQLDGVGRKTANVVLGNAFDTNVGVVVDTHVARLSRRLALSRESDPVKVEADLMKLVPQSEWCRFSHQLIWHGRRRCSARTPQCGSCELAELCPSYAPSSIEANARKDRRSLRTA